MDTLSILGVMVVELVWWMKGCGGGAGCYCGPWGEQLTWAQSCSLVKIAEALKGEVGEWGCNTQGSARVRTRRDLMLTSHLTSSTSVFYSTSVLHPAHSASLSLYESIWISSSLSLFLVSTPHPSHLPHLFFPRPWGTIRLQRLTLV